MNRIHGGARSKQPGRVFRNSLAALGATSMLMAFGMVTAGVASAATQTVTVTSLGYVPSTSTIAIGDSIGFVNGDLVVHEVAFNKKSGVSCSATPLVLKPGGSGQCTFQSAGSYTYSDPTVKGKSYSGTVVVSNVSPSVSLAVTPGIAVYGHGEQLTGTISSKQSGASVQILSQVCNQASASTLSTVTTTTGGAFIFVAEPLNKTVYSAREKNATSNSVLTQVRPRLALRRISVNRFTLRITAAASFAGRYVTLQRFNTSLGRWVNMRNATIRKNSSGVAPTVVSSLTFSTRLAGRQRVRTILPQVEVGSCYRVSVSSAVYNR